MLRGMQTHTVGDNGIHIAGTADTYALGPVTILTKVTPRALPGAIRNPQGSTCLMRIWPNIPSRSIFGIARAEGGWESAI